MSAETPAVQNLATICSITMLCLLVTFVPFNAQSFDTVLHMEVVLGVSIFTDNL